MTNARVPANVGALVDAVAEIFPVHKSFLVTAVDNAAESELQRLSDYLAFCESKGLDNDYLADSYLTIVGDTIEEQLFFNRNKHYRHSTFAEVAESVYHDADYMNRYMYGLAISTFLWPNHVAMLRMFRTELPRTGGGRYLEVGPGHGFLLLTAAEVGGYEEFLAVDLSDASVRQTETIVQHFHPGSSVQVRKMDFLDAADLEPHSFDAIVMGEVAEHVEEPERFLRRIAELATADAFIFITTCINAPAVDHIYLWRTTGALEEMIEASGLDVVKALRLPYEGTTLAESVTRELPINVAYVLRVRA
ncbi:MAG: class I SAM-dependent methyltransferase [Jatrophihabitantaceae bacterium]